jgi:hypothetical protein
LNNQHNDGSNPCCWQENKIRKYIYEKKILYIIHLYTT